MGVAKIIPIPFGVRTHFMKGLTGSQRLIGPHIKFIFCERKTPSIFAAANTMRRDIRLIESLCDFLLVLYCKNMPVLYGFP